MAATALRSGERTVCTALARNGVPVMTADAIVTSSASTTAATTIALTRGVQNFRFTASPLSTLAEHRCAKAAQQHGKAAHRQPHDGKIVAL